jgi:hypothetical protein
MNTATQVLEKNHFPLPQNRATSLMMSEIEKRRGRMVMVLLAAGLILAILAPVAVLAA